VANPIPTVAYEHCQRVTKAEAKNFYYAFVTLPKPRRLAIYAAYAFCRLCDDIADEAFPVEEKLRQLHEVENALERTKNGSPEGYVYEALAHAVAEYAIPWEDLIEVIRGVEMDLTISRYETFDDLRSYCYRVASVVGLICIQVCGYSDPKAREYAIDLGLAMQLTNILRDIKEDSEIGRVYLPQEELARFGYSEEQLMAGEIDENFTKFMEFQVARARDYFEKGKRLLKLLPMRTRACPSVLGGIYSHVLDHIEDNGYDVYERRISLPSREKLFLTVRLWCQSYVPLERVATAW
jgi:phytoene synthase